jgi:hypothetical protein
MQAFATFLVSFCIIPSKPLLTESLECKPRKLTELTIAQLGRIADAVEHNDPEQWREHQAPPATPEPEDYGTKVKEMAEIVRNEDTYKNDPVLHGLDDSALLILWALRTSSKIKADIIWLLVHCHLK